MYRQIFTAFILLLSAQITLAQSNVGQRTFQFKDGQRSNRPVTTEIWYPTTDTVKASDNFFSRFLRTPTVRNGKLPARKLPIIMLSHGTGGGRLTLEWLASALAQSGFIVAAVDHWGNTYDNKILIEFLKTWERPLDISFALTSLLNEKDFKTVIDANRIGAAGYSFGGYTVIALAGGQFDFEQLKSHYNTVGKKELDIPEFPGLINHLDDSALVADEKHIPPMADKRIKSFFSISPALGPGFIKKQHISRPVFIVGSQSDSIAVVKSNAERYHRFIKGSQLYINSGKTGHYVMLSEATEPVKKEMPVLFTDDPSVNRHAVHLKVDSLAVAFFRKTLCPPAP